ncbi:sodium/potassium-transporting ATPase subunit beta [Plakobranchus ocellatus]|uniref:Sodium/potassium-transporting ATPase subunit beta n=1 Tax=Plakobranchus ocellatus TaxID=259542 RepID=A0AAV4BZE7_9GAST|nr:sodium/potassium-transporting ATPase subunit beta [Plakobranchus ocellatus]
MEKPTMKQRLASFGTFLYDSETKQVLGRSGRSWGEIGIFYVIYYACLAAFFAATLAVFNQTLDDDNPKLQGSSSLLKGNPGMGFQPMPDIDTTLIYSTKEGKDEYVKSIEKVLSDYKLANSDGVDCSQVKGIRQDADKPCRMNFTELTAGCNLGNSYGIMEGNPCVLLKLNRIYGWKPEIWTKAEIANEEDIAESIRNQYVEDRIWIDCHGENPADSDNLAKATTTYYPQQGFPLAFYPYTKQKGYMSPLVFVKFSGLAKHLAYMIECKALAKNIAVDRTEKEGSVHFELLID